MKLKTISHTFTHFVQYFVHFYVIHNNLKNNRLYYFDFEISETIGIVNEDT